MRASLLGTLTIAGLLVAAGPGQAHHSFAAIFDREDPIDLTGNVTQVEWGDPHKWFCFHVEHETGVIDN